MTALHVRISNYDLYTPSREFLKNLNLDLRSGEIQFLKGPNGTGKSTLLRAIFSALSLKKQSPHIQLLGVESFSYLPQNLNREFFIPLSLGEVAKLAGNSNEHASLLKDLLPEYISTRMWNAASGGEKQRAVLAQALSKKNSLYLLDEPFNHLDTDSIEVAAKAIYSLAGLGATFIIATHSVPQSLNLKSTRTLQFENPLMEPMCH